MATPTNLPASFVSGAILTAAQQNDLRGAFRVLQVIYSTTATFTTFGDTTYADSNLTATITPQSTTSKILVLAFNNGCVRGSEDSGNDLNLRIVRGATQITSTDRTMKTLSIIAGLAIALMFVVTSCTDRIRDNCETKPEAPRCDTSTGATTP
jgi:hypothetical protein